LSASFTNNTAKQVGGAIAAGKDTYILFTSATVSFTNNTAGRLAGAILAGESILSFVNSNTVFLNNRTAEYGGAILSVKSNISFNDSSVSFMDNVAKEAGAALAISESSISFTNSTVSFVKNSAQSGGAAIDVFDASIPYIFFTNSAVSFIGNTTKGDGAAICIRGAMLVFTNSQITFRDNKARGGLSDIHFGRTSRFLTFSGNNILTNGIRTSGEGGDITIMNNSILTFYGDSDIKSRLSNYGTIVFASGISNIERIYISGPGLYLKNSSDISPQNTRITVKDFILDKNSTLSFEIDFKNKTTPILSLPAKVNFMQGAKLEIINLTPDAAQAKILIINFKKANTNWQNLVYDKDKYELSYEKGNLYIINKQ
jgi:predicted outer membrane repeat protein